MNIETKAGIGDQVFVLKKITRTECPICCGTGKIRLGSAALYQANSLDEAMKQITDQIVECLVNDNTKEYCCPECNGSGTVKVTGQKKYEVIPCKIAATHITIGGDGTAPSVKYTVMDQNGHARMMTGDQFFTDEEAANKQCFILNLDRMDMPLADIRIPYSFAKTIPCNEKLNKRLDEWRRNRKFDTEIYVDSENNLFDGYTAYLIYKMLGYETVPVVLWPSVKNNKEEKTDAVSV